MSVRVDMYCLVEAKCHLAINLPRLRHSVVKKSSVPLAPNWNRKCGSRKTTAVGERRRFTKYESNISQHVFTEQAGAQ